MKRRLFNLAAALSLMLCVATAALWVRSLGHFEQVTMRYRGWPAAEEYRTGHVGFSWYSNTLRLVVTRFTRHPARFRQLLHPGLQDTYRREMSEFRTAHPAGWRWWFDGDEVTRDMNGYPPGFAARHSPYRDDPARPGDQWVLAVRPWLPAVVFAVLPAMWLRRFLKARRARRLGLCASCGYDLRETPARCPECGLEQEQPGGAVAAVP